LHPDGRTSVLRCALKIPALFQKLAKFNEVEKTSICFYIEVFTFLNGEKKTYNRKENG